MHVKTNRPTSVGGPLVPLYTTILHAIFAPDVETVTAEVLACMGPTSQDVARLM